MNLFTQVFRRKYNDQQLVSVLEKAITMDPLVRDPTLFTVSSQKGVIRVTGTVYRASEKERIEELIRSALSIHNLTYDQLINEIQII